MDRIGLVATALCLAAACKQTVPPSTSTPPKLDVEVPAIPSASEGTAEAAKPAEPQEPLPVFEPKPRDCWTLTDVEWRSETEPYLRIDAPECEPEWCSAAEAGNPGWLKSALEQAGKRVVECRCEGGRTLLHEAALAGDDDLLNELLSSGATTGVCDSQGLTPLHYAAREGVAPAVQSLLRAHAFCDAAALDGQRPLHVALHRLPLRSLVDDSDYWRYRDTISSLLDGGADIEAVDLRGNRPLHIGASMGELELVQMLVDRGADVNATNAEGHRPDQEALIDEVIEWLENRR
jgi:hypothetical protein